MVDNQNTFQIPPTPSGRLPAFQIFLDLDGVYANFKSGWEESFGEAPPKKPTEEQWGEFIGRDGFLSLPEMPWVEELVKLLTPGECTPVVLTGAPASHLEEAEAQKRSWCQEHLGLSPDRVVVTKSYLKPCWAAECRLQGVIPILLDDTPKARLEWEHAGGIFVLYKAPERIKGIWDLEYCLGSLCNFTREWRERESLLGDIRQRLWEEFKKGNWLLGEWVGEPRPHTRGGEEIMATRFTQVVKQTLTQVRAEEEAARVAAPLVTGADLILLGHKPGIPFGKALRAAKSLQDSGERDYATLLRAAEEML